MCHPEPAGEGSRPALSMFAAPSPLACHPEWYGHGESSDGSWGQKPEILRLQRIAKDLTCQATNPCLERSRETSSRVPVNEVSRLRSRHEGIPVGPTSLHTAVHASPRQSMREKPGRGAGHNRARLRQPSPCVLTFSRKLRWFARRSSPRQAGGWPGRTGQDQRCNVLGCGDHGVVPTRQFVTIPGGVCLEPRRDRRETG